jgi:hypothetical protein
MSFTSLPVLKIMLIAAGRQRPALDKLFACQLSRQCPCQTLGKKVTPCNYLIIKIKPGVRDIFLRRLAGLFCQDFLQCVKPVREGLAGINLGLRRR